MLGGVAGVNMRGRGRGLKVPAIENNMHEHRDFVLQGGEAFKEGISQRLVGDPPDPKHIFLGT